MIERGDIMGLDRKPIWIKEASEKVMNYKKRGDWELLALEESDGRYLYEDLIADHDVPPFDRSPYDGFAIRAEDTENGSKQHPITLKVIDEIGAGQVSSYEVKRNEAIRIMTGAPIPKGADCVIMLELVQEKKVDLQTYITIKRKLKSGDNISFRGEDTRKGSPLIKRGTIVTPGVKALLATFGYHKVKVATPPLIGVIATGSELLDPSEPLTPGKIRNSNGYMIESQIIRAGGRYKKYGSTSDDVKDLLEVVKLAMSECDFVITTGGVSVGDFDYLPTIYKELNATVLFNKIAMRPGSVTSCGIKEEQLLFGLSGNPSACYVGFELFVRPYIQYWLHSSKPYIKFITATLNADFSKPNPFSRFVRGKISYEGGRVYAEPVGLDKSGVVTSLAWADCFIVLPGSTRGYKQGSDVEILLLHDFEGSDQPWMEKRFTKL